MECRASLGLWNELPADLAYSIARRLWCPVDRFYMSEACSTWKEGLRRLWEHRTIPAPTSLPWLLLPYRRVADNPRRRRHRRRRQGQRIRFGRFYCVLCGLTHRAWVPLNTGGARFFGTYPGGWVFIAYGQNCHHALVNLHTPERPPLRLPNVLLRNNREKPMFMLAATLSAPPVPGNNCVAAAIIMTIPVSFPKKITVWRLGSPRPTFHWEPESEVVDVQDVIYHNGAFYFINRASNLLVFRPDFQEGAPLEPLQVHREDLSFLPLFMGGGMMVKSRYLVESRGELLMLARQILGPLADTLAFRVFRMTPPPDAAHADYSWTELPALDGRMLFVGRGCSRSYEVADFPGSEERVYFHDECFYNDEVEMISRYGVRDDREYPCSDNGACWEVHVPGAVNRLYQALAPSTYSSPVWFLH